LIEINVGSLERSLVFFPFVEAKMKRAIWLAAVVASLLAIFSFWAPSGAQSTETSLQSVRTAIVQAIAASDPTLDVKVMGNIFVVSRINTDLNQANHSARDSEASRIATVAAKTIADKPEFKNIHTIRVLYVASLKSGRYEKIIDTVDFRKDPSGVFHFHTT
jgi:hypothetical protein